MNRAPSTASQRTFGSTLQKPFLPGGMHVASSARKAATPEAQAVAADITVDASLYAGQLSQVL
jgi:hypothetical protein